MELARRQPSLKSLQKGRHSDGILALPQTLVQIQNTHPLPLRSSPSITFVPSRIFHRTVAVRWNLPSPSIFSVSHLQTQTQTLLLLPPFTCRRGAGPCPCPCPCCSRSYVIVFFLLHFHFSMFAVVRYLRLLSKSKE